MRRIFPAVFALALLAAGCGVHNAAPSIRVQPHKMSIRFGGPPPSSPAVGDILTTSGGKWSGSPTGFAYLWQDCDSNGANCTTAAGSPTNAKRYVIVAGDQGFTIRVKVTASYSGHPDAAVQSQPTGIVGGSGSSPSNTAAPAVIDTTLLNNYEQPDTVQSSAGSWTNCSGAFSCTYTYQFQRCTGISGGVGTGCSNIGSPQCSATSATTCTYALAAGDVGDYIVAAVTATNGSGSSSATASQAQGTVVASRVNQPCTITAALTTWGNQSGPHLCGWPDTTNVGYANAPGFNGSSTGGAYLVNPTPGSLTTASSGSGTCPTTIQSNHTYSFCQYSGLSIPAAVTNVTFYGDAFFRTNPQNANVAGGNNATNITFDYDTFQPAITYPGASATCTGTSCTSVTCAQSYQYGIYNEGGAMKGYTVTHSWFWGFGNAIDTAGSTQSAPQVFKYNYFSDAVTEGSCGYHTDGIGMLNTNTQSYATVDHNAFAFVGNTNEIAWQNGSYDHITNTNNLMDGDNAMYAGARCTTACTAATNIATTGNTLDAFMPHGAGNYPTDLAGGYATATGSTWNHNYWMVPPGSSSTSAAGTGPSSPGTHNGEFVLPRDNSSGFPNDCGWVSATDYPNTTTDC